MITSNIKYGLFNDESDLLYNAPSLGKLKKRFPQYIKNAEKAQLYGRRLARDVLLPKALETDEKCHEDPTFFDQEVWKAFNDAKINICWLPKEFGGLGWSMLDYAAAAEELLAADIGNASTHLFNGFWIMAVVSDMRLDLFMHAAREIIQANNKKRPVFFSWAVTEPAGGTDNLFKEPCKTGRPTMEIEKMSGGYQLNGSKCFISNGSLAHYVLFAASVDRERPLETMGCFFVPTDSKGFSVGRVEHKMGQKAFQTAELVLKDVFVPDKNIWVQPGKGMQHTTEILSVTSGSVALNGIAVARGAVEKCIQFACQKKTGGLRLIDENWVQIAIAEMLGEIKAVRSRFYDFVIALDTLHFASLMTKVPMKLAMIPRELLLTKPCKWITDQKRVSDITSAYKKSIVPEETVNYFKSYSSELKVTGSNLGMKITSRVLDIVGLEGMTRDHGIEKLFRDAKLLQIYDGINQVHSVQHFNDEFRKVIR